MPPKPIATAIDAAPRDEFQREVKSIVTVEKEWVAAQAAAPEAVEGVRRQQIHDLFDGAEQVDLVGHSTPLEGYLRLGDWILGPDEARRFASYLPPSVTSVRLIGCATALKDSGRAAIEAFAHTGRSAYGTINFVYTTHFDHAGVKRGGGGPPLKQILAALDDAAPPHPAPPRASTQAVRLYAPSVAIAPQARRLLRRMTAPIVRPVKAFFATLRWTVGFPVAMKRFPRRWILRLLSPFATAMPGLLTDPLLKYEIRSGRRTWHLEILFDFEYARFYSTTDAGPRRDHVYKIRAFKRVAKTLLEAYLELAPKGVTLIERHVEAGTRGGTLHGR